MTRAFIHDLLRFLDAAPTPWHATAEVVARLTAAGYRTLDEREPWQVASGDRVLIVRGGSLVAFVVGRRPPSEAGFRLIGAHTDSPNLRVKPQPTVEGEGAWQLAVEPYGGVLLHTWLDRDLSVAGRVWVRGADGPEARLVRLEGAVARVPSLAIHLDREVNTSGLVLNAQQHMAPLTAVPGGEAWDLTARLAADLGVGADDVVGHDLCLFDVTPAALGGAREELLFSARLDNLASCHAGLAALLDAGDPGDATRGLVLYDHEEVGSRSAQGADSPFLAEALTRLAHARDAGPDAAARAFARSFLVSADMAHALHPNYADRHEKGHRPVLGGGPVIKTNVNQRYATDGETTARFLAWCRAADVKPQHFVTRSDLACGSTIGPITAGRLGIRTIDVGNPMLSMHSCREMASAVDHGPMVAVMTAFYRASA
ncbi:MAG: M18 family aminopeptidase [Sandaracinaceae bacterium]